MREYRGFKIDKVTRNTFVILNKDGSVAEHLNCFCKFPYTLKEAKSRIDNYLDDSYFETMTAHELGELEHKLSEDMKKDVKEGILPFC